MDDNIKKLDFDELGEVTGGVVSTKVGGAMNLNYKKGSGANKASNTLLKGQAPAGEALSNASKSSKNKAGADSGFFLDPSNGIKC